MLLIPLNQIHHLQGYDTVQFGNWRQVKTFELANVPNGVELQ
jgi:hypothetical protein